MQQSIARHEGLLSQSITDYSLVYVLHC